MKNKKTIILTSLIAVMLTMCSCVTETQVATSEKYDDHNNNYTSKDVDENGDIISGGESQYNKEHAGEDSSSKNDDNITEVSYDSDLMCYFIDVGNADCNLIILPNEQTMLIDAGNNADGKDICSYIKSLGITRLDYVIGTHPHEDHIGGMDDVVENFDIGSLYLPYITDKDAPTTTTWADLLQSVSDEGLSVINPTAGDMLVDEDGLYVEILNDTFSTSSDNMNDYSLVVKITYGDTVFLYQGDAEENIEEELLDTYGDDFLKADVLKVGHHGSYSSSSDAYIKAVSPTYAFIPCGTGNQYGHPHDVTLNTLDKYNVEYYRADTDGTVLMTSNGKDISIQTGLTGKISLGDDGWDLSMCSQ